MLFYPDLLSTHSKLFNPCLFIFLDFLGAAKIGINTLVHKKVSDPLKVVINKTVILAFCFLYNL